MGRYMRIAVLFDNLGPYHVARLGALARHCDLLAVEVHARSAEYGWDPALEVPFERMTLTSRSTTLGYSVGLGEAPARFAPDVIFLPGWSSPEALRGHLWAVATATPTIVMSDSQSIDFPRYRAKEWLKRGLVRHVAGALVGGSRHVDYARTLLPAGTPIRHGYDVVDNDHFRVGAQAARADAVRERARLALPERYWLASARFLEKKNLVRLLQAYARSRHAVAQVQGVEPWDLVLLGDGPLRPEIEACIASLGLRSVVHMAGFRQYAELPAFYGLAQAFVMPSIQDQWGLVVNEAMATGLPVVVSKACGCAADLVEPGANGFVIDPLDVADLSRALAEMNLSDPIRLEGMSTASSARIESWSPDLFAESAMALAGMALARPRRRVPSSDRLLLATVARLQNRGGMAP